MLGSAGVLRVKAAGGLIERNRTVIAPGVVEVVAPIGKDAHGEVRALHQEKPACRADDCHNQQHNQKNFQNIFHSKSS